MVANLVRVAARIAVAFLFIFGVLILVGVTPIVYNSYVFPLGQLRGDVSIGEDFESVLVKFDNYAKRYAWRDDMQYAKGTKNYNMLREPIPETKFLFLYDVSIFDDIQLEVLFDGSDRVKEINFIGD